MATATEESGTVTIDADRIDALRGRLRDDAPPQREQLTFELGIGRGAEPDFATLKIGGQLSVQRDLRYQEHVTVTVTDAHGEIVTSAPATIGWPAFKDKTTGELTFTERAHTATLD